jgi:hypothetical protein
MGSVHNFGGENLNRQLLLFFFCTDVRWYQTQETNMVKKPEVTSKAVASKASKLLSNPKTPPAVKSVAASALTQTGNKGRKK